VAKDEGEARWWFASLAVIKATAVDTGGQMTIIEITEPPGSQAPLHVHHREDESFWILEGDLTAAQSSSFESGAGKRTRNHIPARWLKGHLLKRPFPATFPHQFY
jgi:hypothetical protein